MTANDSLPAVLCLFHESADCRCCPKVSTRGELIYRLRRQLNLNNLLNAQSANPQTIRERNRENERLQKRLEDLNQTR